MKFSIRFFDQVLVEVYLGRNEDGAYSIQKIFPVFLGRPARPHLSLFLGDRILKPHFTAANGRFRGWFPRVSSAAFAEICENLAGEAARDAVARVETVDFRALEEAGWTIHWADQRALRRWVRQASRHSSEFRVDSNTVGRLFTHVLRHAALPTHLESAAPEFHLSVFALRCDETNEPEVRVLSYYPRGLGSLGAVEKPFAARPPGWYSRPFEALEDEKVARVLPSVAIKKAVSQIKHWLSWYPRRDPPIDIGEIPDYVMEIFGFYGLDLFNYILADALQGDRGPEDTRSPTLSHA